MSDLVASRVQPADLVTVDDLADFCRAAVRLAFRGDRYGTAVTDEAAETLFAEVCRGIMWANVPWYPKVKRAARSSVNGGPKVIYSKRSQAKSKDTVALRVSVLAFPKSCLPPFGELIGRARNLRKSADRAAAHKKEGADPFDAPLIAADEGNRAPHLTIDGAKRAALAMLDELGMLRPLDNLLRIGQPYAVWTWSPPAGDAPIWTLAYSAARYPTLYALDVDKPGEQMARELDMTHAAYRKAMSRAAKLLPSVAAKHKADVARGGSRPAMTADGPLLIRPKAKHDPRTGRRGGLRPAYADALSLPLGGIAQKASRSRTHSADLESTWRAKLDEDAPVAGSVGVLAREVAPATVRPAWTDTLSAAKRAQLTRRAAEQGRKVPPAAPAAVPAVYAEWSDVATRERHSARIEGDAIGGALDGRHLLPSPAAPGNVVKLGSAPAAAKVDPVQHAPDVARAIAAGRAIMAGEDAPYRSPVPHAPAAPKAKVSKAARTLYREMLAAEQATPARVTVKATRKRATPMSAYRRACLAEQGYPLAKVS